MAVQGESGQAWVMQLPLEFRGSTSSSQTICFLWIHRTFGSPKKNWGAVTRTRKIRKQLTDNLPSKCHPCPLTQALSQKATRSLGRKVTDFELELPAGAHSHTFQLTAQQLISTDLRPSTRWWSTNCESHRPSGPSPKHPMTDEGAKDKMSICQSASRHVFPVCPQNPSTGSLSASTNILRHMLGPSGDAMRAVTWRGTIPALAAGPGEAGAAQC